MTVTIEMNKKVIGGFATLLLIFACMRTWQEKINFDLTAINDEGLEGPADGLRSVAYEFCIPMTEAARDEVAGIDPEVKFYEGAGGRIGCTKGQYLCLSDTHQPEFRKVLRQLAGLDYVDRIERTYFE